jgi:hypothetical protein
MILACLRLLGVQFSFGVGNINQLKSICNLVSEIYIIKSAELNLAQILLDFLK